MTIDEERIFMTLFYTMGSKPGMISKWYYVSSKKTAFFAFFEFNPADRITA